MFLSFSRHSFRFSFQRSRPWQETHTGSHSSSPRSTGQGEFKHLRQLLPPFHVRTFIFFVLELTGTVGPRGGATLRGFANNSSDSERAPTHDVPILQRLRPSKSKPHTWTLATSHTIVEIFPLSSTDMNLFVFLISCSFNWNILSWSTKVLHCYRMIWLA